MMDEKFRAEVSWWAQSVYLPEPGAKSRPLIVAPRGEIILFPQDADGVSTICRASATVRVGVALVEKPSGAVVASEWLDAPLEGWESVEYRVAIWDAVARLRVRGEELGLISSDGPGLPAGG